MLDAPPRAGILFPGAISLNNMAAKRSEQSIQTRYILIPIFQRLCNLIKVINIILALSKRVEKRPKGAATQILHSISSACALYNNCRYDQDSNEFSSDPTFISQTQNFFHFFFRP